MTIETERLILREMQLEDADAFNAYRDNEAYGRYTTVAPQQDFDMVAHIQKRLITAAELPKHYWPFSIILKSDNSVIGDVRIWSDEKTLTICQLAYGLNPDYWGNGYMSEAITEIVKHCHDILKMHRVVARADARNIASWRIAEKAGMQYEGTTRYEIPTWQGFMPELKGYASVRPELISGN